MRMISREDLKQKVMEHFCGSCSMPYKDTDILELGEYCCDMVSDTIAFIDELPTIEAEPIHENPEKAEPVKHGRWLDNGIVYTCSECNSSVPKSIFVIGCDFDGCPYCFARMDGDSE